MSKFTVQFTVLSLLMANLPLIVVFNACDLDIVKYKGNIVGVI